MTSHPTAIDLIEAVSRLIDQRARPQLNKLDAYLAHVAVAALATVRMELEQGHAARAAATQRVAVLLGHEGDLAAIDQPAYSGLKTVARGA